MNHKIFFKKIIVLLILFIFLDFLISVILLHGLNKYYGIYQDPDILINGSSMAMSGFNRTALELIAKKRIANYSHEGVSVEDRFAMINHFFHKNPRSVKTVIYELNPLIFSGTHTADNVYTIFYPYLDDRFIDRFVKERASNKEYYINKIIRTKRFDSRLIINIIKGYLGKYENLKTNTLDTAKMGQLIAQKGKTKIIMKSSDIEVFEKTMDLIRYHHSSIVLVMMPMFYIKLQTFDNEGYYNLCKYFEDYCSYRDNTNFLDLNRDSITLNADYFSDQLHFNVYGQRYITNMICGFLIEK